MDYKITFLGVAGNNSSYSQLKSSAGIILKFNNQQFHIDPGPGTLTSAKELSINLKETDIIISTHQHFNHSHDVNAVINAITNAGSEKKGTLVVSNSLAEEKFLKDYLKEFFSLAPNQTKIFDNVLLTTLETIHHDPTAIGLKFTTPGLIITYTSDTGYSKEVVQQYKNSDILIINNVFPANSKKDSNNLSTEDTIKILNTIKPSLAIIQHYSAKMLEANPLYEARNIQQETNIQTIAAKDGLIINPSSKFIPVRQKSLEQY